MLGALLQDPLRAEEARFFLRVLVRVAHHSDWRSGRLSCVCKDFKFCVELAVASAWADLRAAVRFGERSVCGVPLEVAVSVSKKRERRKIHFSSRQWEVGRPARGPRARTLLVSSARTHARKRPYSRSATKRE